MNGNIASAQVQELKPTVQPGEMLTINVTGSFIVINEGGTDLYFSLGDGTPLPATSGIRFTMPDGQMFQRVTLENRGTEPVAVKLLAGQGDWQDFRTEISGSVSISPGSAPVVVQGRTPATWRGGDHVELLPGATATVLPADAGRAAGIVQVIVGGPVHFGDADHPPDATAGAVVYEGGHIATDTPTAMQSYNASAGKVLLAISILPWEVS